MRAFRNIIIGGIAVTVVAMTAVTAQADHTEGPPECVTIVDEEGYTTEGPIQRYSYTGGPQGLDEGGTPIQTTAPGSDWQANTTLYNDGTSHGGNLGLYFVSHGNSGNGDWFYWEVGIIEVPPVTHEECHDATPTDPPPTEPPPTEEPPTDEWTPSWTPTPVRTYPGPNQPPAGDLPVTGISGAAIAGLAGFGLLGTGALFLARRRLLA